MGPRLARRPLLVTLSALERLGVARRERAQRAPAERPVAVPAGATALPLPAEARQARR
jgi:hypothetical protein